MKNLRQLLSVNSAPAVSEPVSKSALRHLEGCEIEIFAGSFTHRFLPGIIEKVPQIPIHPCTVVVGCNGTPPDRVPSARAAGLGQRERPTRLPEAWPPVSLARPRRGGAGAVLRRAGEAAAHNRLPRPRRRARAACTHAELRSRCCSRSRALPGCRGKGVATALRCISPAMLAFWISRPFPVPVTTFPPLRLLRGAQGANRGRRTARNALRRGGCHCARYAPVLAEHHGPEHGHQRDACARR